MTTDSRDAAQTLSLACQNSPYMASRLCARLLRMIAEERDPGKVATEAAEIILEAPGLYGSRPADSERTLAYARAAREPRVASVGK